MSILFVRSAAIIHLLSGEGDAVKVLKFCQKEYVKYKKSTFPKVLFYVMGSLGWYVAPIARYLAKIYNVPALLTSFPMGIEHLSSFGHSVVECFGCLGMLVGVKGD